MKQRERGMKQQACHFAVNGSSLFQDLREPVAAVMKSWINDRVKYTFTAIFAMRFPTFICLIFLWYFNTAVFCFGISMYVCLIISKLKTHNNESIFSIYVFHIIFFRRLSWIFLLPLSFSFSFLPVSMMKQREHSFHAACQGIPCISEPHATLWLITRPPLPYFLFFPEIRVTKTTANVADGP